MFKPHFTVNFVLLLRSTPFFSSIPICRDAYFSLPGLQIRIFRSPFLLRGLLPLMGMIAILILTRLSPNKNFQGTMGNLLQQIKSSRGIDDRQSIWKIDHLHLQSVSSLRLLQPSELRNKFESLINQSTL